jgi:hypothetical protein
MDTTTSVVATGLVVGVGRWSQEKPVTIKMFVGLGATAIFLAVIAASDEGLASKFSLLLLISAVLYYGVPIGKKLGGLK